MYFFNKRENKQNKNSVGGKYFHQPSGKGIADPHMFLYVSSTYSHILLCSACSLRKLFYATFFKLLSSTRTDSLKCQTLVWFGSMLKEGQGIFRLDCRAMYGVSPFPAVGSIGITIFFFISYAGVSVSFFFAMIQVALSFEGGSQTLPFEIM